MVVQEGHYNSDVQHQSSHTSSFKLDLVVLPVMYEMHHVLESELQWC